MKPPAQAHILVIEDDEAIRATLVDTLEINGYTVTQAANGLDGAELAAKKRPDVITTDLHMPGLDGFELLEKLRADEQTRAIPVIIISASVEPERMRHGMNIGADDFIFKPFTEDQVLRSISARLEKKALLDELDAFAHTVAHDLKGPIAAVSMLLELLQMQWQTAPDDKKLELVAKIHGNARRFAGIVDELLVLAGVGRQNVKSVPVMMPGVVEEALGRIEHLVKKSGATVERPSAWPVAFGHAPWAVEIWANYLSNAVKYGGQPPRLILGAEAHPERNRVRFWVQDNGPGLTPQQQAGLFLQFSRVTETRVQGHGLGLSIVRRIAEKLGGAVGVDSQVGSGSCFWFELPASLETPAA